MNLNIRFDAPRVNLELQNENDPYMKHIVNFHHPVASVMLLSAVLCASLCVCVCVGGLVSRERDVSLD